jgi:dTDP-4-dehydrorhamnose 3,5-epimerase
MTLVPTSIHGAFVIEPKRFADHRGDFYRSFDIEVFEQNKLVTVWDYVATAGNHRAGTLRGMHLQRDPHGETKLVRAIRGKVFDVAVDLRRDSPTYLKWAGVELSYENQKQFYIPVGCAHGYLTLEDQSDVAYCIAGRYAPTAAGGVRWNDPAFGIVWPSSPSVIIDRDANYPDYSA